MSWLPPDYHGDTLGKLCSLFPVSQVQFSTLKRQFTQMKTLLNASMVNEQTKCWFSVLSTGSEGAVESLREQGLLPVWYLAPLAYFLHVEMDARHHLHVSDEHLAQEPVIICPLHIYSLEYSVGRVALWSLIWHESTLNHNGTASSTWICTWVCASQLALKC